MSGEDGKLVLLSVPSSGVTARASSVLQKNTKLYGPMNALDLENQSSCWNSDGSPSGKTASVYSLDFGRIVQPVKVKIQFQAGFVGEEVHVFAQDGSTWTKLIELEADDDHDLQEFELQEDPSSPSVQTSGLRFSFGECTDFYGRVTIYQIQVWGLEVPNP